MSHYLDDLTKNNDHPSDKALLEVKELLLEPWKQLEETNIEIDRLEKLIRGLKEKQTTIEQTINRYSWILAPIRRVPPDILHTIFAQYLPTHRNSTMAASESPILLTRVCSSWRSTALASPRLWAQIHIPFRKEIGGHGRHHGDPAVPLEKVTDVLRLRCRGAKEWLARSGDCPLSISINRPDTITKLLLNTLLPFSSRWRTLELNAPMSVYYQLESMLSGSNLLLLAQFRARVYHPGYISEIPGGQPPPLLLKAPNLKRVSIDMPNISPWWRMSDTPQLVTGNSLAHLSIFSACTLQDCIILLKLHPRLVHFDITAISSEPHVNLSIHQMVYLPSLRSLWIKVPSSSPFSSLAFILFMWIDAPKLRWLKYQNKATATAGNHFPAMDEIPASSIQRATNLTKLDIDRFSLSSSNVFDIVQLASQNALIHLSLNSTSNHTGLTIPDPFDLELIIVDDILDRSPTSPVLLPHLEVFELQMTKVSDDTVLRFITSRMNTLSDIAVLRKVRICFDRLREQDGLDIAEEIRRRAEMAGIQIDVGFQYLLSSLQVDRQRNFPSPSFIMASYDNNDRTWDYKELEE